MNCLSPDHKPDWKAYALGESDPETRRQAETHAASCAACRDELATLRLTLDTLSTLREEEIPRRIAFVSDKVFEPRWWQRMFTPGFAGACIVAIAIVIHALIPPPQEKIDAEVKKAIGPYMQMVYMYVEQKEKVTQEAAYRNNTELIRH